MKGTLHKTKYDWVIRFRKPDLLYRFEIPVHSDSILQYNTDLVEYQDKEVDFEIVWGPNPYDGSNECEFAKLKIERPILTWDDLADLFAEERAVELAESKLSFIPFLNWLKKKYRVPERL